MSLRIEEFPFAINVALNWGDMDAYQHINNTVYFRYFEEVRVAYFDKLGVHRYKDEHNVGPILATTMCNFRRPLTYPDRISIATKIQGLSDKKFSMEYVVFSESQGQIVADGSALVVYFDYSANKSCSVPEEIVMAIHSCQSQGVAS